MSAMTEMKLSAADGLVVSSDGKPVDIEGQLYRLWGLLSSIHTLTDFVVI